MWSATVLKPHHIGPAVPSACALLYAAECLLVIPAPPPPGTAPERSYMSSQSFQTSMNASWVTAGGKGADPFFSRYI